MRATLLLTLVALCTWGYSQRVENWKEDMDYWMAQVKEQHYVYKSNPLPEGFNEKFESLKSSLNTFSDQRILAELLGLSAMLGDGHTYVLPWTAEGVQTTALPLRFYLFSDGLFVIDAYPGYEKWIGCKVKSIGKVTADEMMQRVSRFISRDNDEGVVWIGPFMLSLKGILEGVGAEGDSTYTVGFEKQGKTLSASIPLVPFQPVRGIPKLIPSKLNSAQTPLYLRHVPTPFWMESMPDHKALYVQFNQVMDAPDESLAQFALQLADSLNTENPSKLVVDVRHNNGGNADLLGPLLSTLQNYTANPDHHLYILTGRNTFSAAQIFISKADYMMHPTFAGEISSSKPNFVGEENVIQLPHSKTICSISNRYHESIPGDHRNAIEPQIKISLSSKEYFAGIDPVLEAVLKSKP